MGGLLYNYEHLKISGLKMSEICQTEEGDGKRKSREKKKPNKIVIMTSPSWFPWGVR